MDLYQGEVIGTALLLIAALYVAIKVLIVEIKEEIEDRNS